MSRRALPQLSRCESEPGPATASAQEEREGPGLTLSSSTTPFQRAWVQLSRPPALFLFFKTYKFLHVPSLPLANPPLCQTTINSQRRAHRPPARVFDSSNNSKSSSIVAPFYTTSSAS